MQSNLLKQIWLMTRYSFYGLCLQCLFCSLLLAKEGTAQSVKLEKINLSIKLDNVKLSEAFIRIEEEVGFNFIYDEKYENKRVSLFAEEGSMLDLLTQLSKEADLRFKRINENIYVSLKDMRNSTMDVIDQVSVDISGKVTDELGQGLPGATIRVKGTSGGATTDVDGNYILTGVPNEATIVFSFIGYRSKETLIAGRSVIDVQMEIDAEQLEEVVVVGYGVQKKGTVTGSVVSIDGEDITKSPSANVTSNLAGRLPGLVVNQRTGQPGRDDPNILIRGNASFTTDPDNLAAANAPLIVVDGVPRANMSRLNPQDIESISVLKDASAAIYGARAANGVILITTKRGAIGKPVFDFSYNHAFQRPTQLLNVLDAAEFAKVFNEAEYYRAGRPDDFTPFYSDDAIARFEDGSDPILYPNTDWVDEVLKSYSVQKRINLSATGGTETVKYFLSLGATTQDGNFRYSPSEYNQYNMRVKVDADLTDNLTVGANISAILNDRKYSSTIGDDDSYVNFYNILHANPTLVARYPNGLIAPGRLGENPLLQDQVGTRTIEDTPLYSTFSMSYKVPFVEGLKVEGSYNYDLNNQLEKTFKTPYSFHEYNVSTEEYEERQATGVSTPELWDTYRKWTTELYNIRLNYEKTLDKHNVGVMVGHEKQHNKFSYAQAYRRNFVSTSIDQIDVGSNAPEDRSNAGTATEGGYVNYFGRLNYDFDGKYLAEFLFRYDGSQIFPKEQRYGFFPGVSLGWRLSEEDFVKNSMPFINHLKLRASHGKIGNDRVDAFQYLQTFSFTDNYVFGGNDVPGLASNVLPNPNITWQVSKKTDFGLDGVLLNGVLGFDFTLWWEDRSNILAQRNVSVPKVFGFSGLPDENIGEVKNRGFELLVSHSNSIGELDYRITANTAFARSKIEFMDEVTNEETPYRNLTGKPIGSPLYYKEDGIINDQTELDSRPQHAGAQIGDIQLVDLNNDGEINGDDQFRFDYTAIPEYTFGMTVDLQYKDFDLSILFQGQTNVYNYDERYRVLGSTAFDNAAVSRAEDRWTVNNVNGSMPRADDSTPGNNTFWVFDATFVRLKSMELGYSVPENLASKIGLTDARFYISGFNLLTWAKEIKWADPEVSGNSLYYPQQRVVNLGVNVKF